MPRLARHLVERLVSLTGDQLDVSHGHQVLAQRVLLAGRVPENLTRGTQESVGAPQLVDAGRHRQWVPSGSTLSESLA